MQKKKKRMKYDYVLYAGRIKYNQLKKIFDSDVSNLIEWKLTAQIDEPIVIV